MARVLKNVMSCRVGGNKRLMICPFHFSATMLNEKPPVKPRTPGGKLDDENATAYKGSNVLEPFPDGINPETGEKGGPRGPEPTRYGDWERKGRVSDF